MQRQTARDTADHEVYQDLTVISASIHYQTLNLTMVLITASTTSPVNPPGATPVLTHDDLWTALVAKARHPEEFVAVIEKSRIIHEDANGLTRGVKFKGDMGNGGEMEEVIKYVGNMKVFLPLPLPRGPRLRYPDRLLRPPNRPSCIQYHIRFVQRPKPVSHVHVRVASSRVTAW